MPQPLVSIQDLADAYEGDLSVLPENRIKYLIRVGTARLYVLVPSLADRLLDIEDGSEDNLSVLARDIVVQAVLRQLRNPSPEYTQQAQTAGPFSVSTNTGTGVGRASRGMFYQEELDLLAPSYGGGVARTHFLPLSYWGAAGAR